ncbi:MAG: lipopolysaccharide biosynthesis protein [Sarcina sp.]
MRLKKSLINSVIGMLTYIISFLPIFIVRKVFIDVLGSDLAGLTSLYTNIIGYLTIIEMGVGTAIICSLYKPFDEENHEKVVGYLKYYKKFYMLAALFIFCVGIVLVPFLHVFIKGNINAGYVKIGFILFLINTVIAYLFGYKQCILNVAQDGYKVSIALTAAKVLIAIAQIFIVEKYHSFYGYLIAQIVINLIFYILINYYIDRCYPWLKETKGKIDKEEKSELIKTIKGVSLHKIGAVLVFGTDNIVISSFIGLTSVTLYNNYMLVINAFGGIVSQAIAGVTASIGNLLLDDDGEHVYRTHKRLFLANFWIASFIAIILVNTLTPFIQLWLGKEFVLSLSIVGLLILNLYFQMIRGQVEQFKNASGEFYRDRYAPLVEGGINLIISLVLVRYIGLIGVLLGTVISNVAVIFWTQPYVVYKYVFKKSLFEYFLRYFKYILIAVIPLVFTMFLTHNLKVNDSFINFILNCFINVVVINVFYLIIFWRTEEFQFFKGLIFKFLKRGN